VQEVIHPDAMDAMDATDATDAMDAVDAATAMIAKQETKFHPFPEWRERILKKCVASGRHGFLTSPAWKAKLNPDTGVYELPRRLQGWRDDDEEEQEGEGTLNEEESEAESMMSDAEWEGWRRELELEGPTRPGSPGLRPAQEGNPWSPGTTEQSFVTESDGLLQSRRRKNTLIKGRDKVLEGIIKRTTEYPAHPYSVLRAQPSGESTSSSVSPECVVVDMVASSGAGLDPTVPLYPSPPPISASISPRQSVSAPGGARSATVATPDAVPKASEHHTNDTNHDLAIPPPDPFDVLEDGRLPGLGGGLSPLYRPYHTVTTIAALRPPDNQPAPKKGMARVWSNKGKRRNKAEDSPTGEEASVENPPLGAGHPDDAWNHSFDEGLNRLRHMSSTGLRRSGSNGGLFKSFSLRDR
jgi:hypothetical protein